MSVDTDPKKIEEILKKGVENIYPTKDFLKSLLQSGKQLKIYTGYDPTAATLHIGHGITLLKLRQFQDLGHKIIMLIGDFTGMIGDPTDKTAVRKKLTREEVLNNCKNYQKQASAILDFEGKNAAEIKYNNEWLGKMNFADILELTAHFTVPRLLERDMFQERLKKNETIYLHEFLYPVMQAYDSVAMDVDGEIGGNDQTFNMLAGRDLMKELKNKEKFVLTMKLLADNSGVKMGKTTGNMVALSDTPEEMFGKIMSWTDGMILGGFEMCTEMPVLEVKDIEKELKAGANPKDLKMRLAGEIVKMYYGEKLAVEAQEHFVKTFTKKEVPEEMMEIKVTDKNILAVLVAAGFVKSKSEARRVVEQGGVQVNNQKIDSIEMDVKSGDMVQKGSRFFVKIK
ncbi:MAG: Tyrosine-tRNA ligase [Candidatus Magasanikbacteria bacterium GW2011_GWC2_40_17]|uniref:Tyrosine--tRNA ligase n=1 Tax=Candidatus Magasanikbacteria bacterium GW2011_GWA2_42_32 TaxID=1619039 RepID=A0A0G1CFB4_9BACT|nr:MAG: Tyrosine-tRNA ligase [Candidatus Magasanikbacteria bacterium GW2011_GWC2_40_17]KKS57266.1 MAG: Tyrosine-tRNA ligase [Candidatus Magasanikbacteria bacterium GW2011_GWA2_42_32]OGH86155.1 MAG: tyrosine--tRNA ligase [Candidatus Magasanikbacteria bacterium RIFOXYB2_FULL_38_10]